MYGCLLILDGGEGGNLEGVGTDRQGWDKCACIEVCEVFLAWDAEVVGEEAGGVLLPLCVIVGW